MSFDDLNEELQKAVDPAAIRPRDFLRNGCHVEVQARADQVEAVAGAALEADLFLESITAVDFADGPQLVYHFNSFATSSRVQVRVKLDRDQSVPSISGFYNGALWHEREVFDLFGVRFDNHPDLRRLLLPEDADFHPLRKDFGKVHACRKTEEIYGEPDA
jgi:NADH-quinone oxidoreductase subunit C